MITLERIDDIVVNGGIVVTSDGARIGSVEQVFLSELSGDPAFVTVRTGLFGMFESFVPLARATIDGSRVLVAFDRNQIKNGPRIESDRGSITAAEENELYLYYGTDAYIDANATDAQETDAQEAAGVPAGMTEAVAAAPAEPTVPTEGPAAAPHPGPPAHPGHPPGPRPGGHHPPHLLKHTVEGHRPPPPPPEGHRPPPPAVS
jgi:hypothetical protein